LEFIRDPYLALYVPFYQLDGGALMSRDLYGHRITTFGTKWTPKGVILDGVNDYISCSNHTILGFTNNFTLEYWLNPDTWTGTKRWVTKADSYVLGGFTNTFKFEINISAAWKSLTVASLPSTGIPHHIVGTYDGASMKLYVDGLIDNKMAQTGDVTVNRNNFQIGRYAAEGDWGDGTMGEIRAYGRCLNPLEIQRNYLATKWRYR